jgi:hypothetical protein
MIGEELFNYFKDNGDVFHKWQRMEPPIPVKATAILSPTRQLRLRKPNAIASPKEEAPEG